MDGWGDSIFCCRRGFRRRAGKKSVVSTDRLLAVLEGIERAGIGWERVRLNLFLPLSLKRNQYHLIEVERSGEVFFNGAGITVADLAKKDFPSAPFVIPPQPKSMMIDYRFMLSLLRAIGSEAKLAGLHLSI